MDPYTAIVNELSDLLLQIPPHALKDEPLPKEGYGKSLLECLAELNITEHQYIFGRTLSSRIINFLTTVPLEFIARVGPLNTVLIEKDIAYILSRYSPISIEHNPLSRSSVVLQSQDMQLQANSGVITLPLLPGVPLKSITVAGARFCLAMDSIRSTTVHTTLELISAQFSNGTIPLPDVNEMTRTPPKKVKESFGTRLPQDAAFLWIPAQIVLESGADITINVRITYYDILTETWHDNTTTRTYLINNGTGR